jgi:hypothetical protein
MSSSNLSHENGRRKKRYDSKLHKDTLPLRNADTRAVAPMPDNTQHDWTPAAVIRDFKSPVTRPNCLKQLSDEILLQIAAELRGTKAISSLSCVSKHLNAITNEAMAKKLVVYEDKSKEAIVWLAKHPELIKSVNAVEVIRPQYVTYLHHYEIADLRFDSDMERVLRNVVIVNTDDPDIWSMLRCYGKLWDRDGAIASWYLLDLVALLCSNIKAITMQQQVLQPFWETIPAL